MRSKGLGSEGSAVLSLELSEVIRKDKSFQAASTACVLSFGPYRHHTYGSWPSVSEGAAVRW